MKTIFLVLVPHRDARVELQKYSDNLIKNGLTGVYPFPWVTPLASLCAPLTPDELKHITRSLRDSTGAQKMTTAETSNAVFPSGAEEMSLFGHRLDLKIPDNLFDDSSKKLTSIFSPLIIGSFLIPKNNEKPISVPCEKITFRAAAVANMYWQPLSSSGESSYKWKIGKLSWLPKANKGDVQEVTTKAQKVHKG